MTCSKALAFIIMAVFSAPMSAQYTRADWAERDTWMNLPLIFEMAEIQVGDKVADIGSHEGYLTYHLLEAVGGSGKVYAVEVVAHRLELLRSYLSQDGITNVETILGENDDPRLPKAALDVVFVVDTYHEIGEYIKVLNLIKQSLKPNGRLVIVEKIKHEHKNKHRQEQAFKHTLSLDYVKQEMEETGFEIVRESKNIGKWQNDDQKTMWILVAKPLI